MVAGASEAACGQGFNANCDPTTFANCVPFGDMDANFSNGSSVYHGFSANLRKRFSRHYEFLASYTWSHAIDDSTDLQSTLTPQDSYFPRLDRSTRCLISAIALSSAAVYQTRQSGRQRIRPQVLERLDVSLRSSKLASGRPFNIITGNGDNLQLSSLTGRPNVTVDPSLRQRCASPSTRRRASSRSLASTDSRPRGYADADAT